MAYVANIAGMNNPIPQRVLRKPVNPRRMLQQQAQADAQLNGAKIGDTAGDVGLSLQSIAPALATIPVVGQIAAIGVKLIGQIISMFGNNYHTSTGVRWLCQYYEKYVLGLNTRSDNTVNENNVPNAQSWFSYVLGVPIYDTYRFCALKGWDHNSESDLHNTDQQRINNYLAFPDCQGVNPQLVAAAVQIAKTLNWTDPLGSWKNRLPAPGVISTTAVNSDTPVGVSPSNPGGTAPAPTKDNTLLWALGGLLLGWGASKFLNKGGKSKNG